MQKPQVSNPKLENVKTLSGQRLTELHWEGQEDASQTQGCDRCESPMLADIKVSLSNGTLGSRNLGCFFSRALRYQDLATCCVRGFPSVLEVSFCWKTFLT